jgi:hypothetical protein
LTRIDANVKAMRVRAGRVLAGRVHLSAVGFKWSSFVTSSVRSGFSGFDRDCAGL